MTLEEQKRVEDKIVRLLGNLTLAEKAVLYKTLYAEGIKILSCNVIIRREPAPEYAAERNATAVTPSQVYLARGIPSTKFP